MPMHITKCLRLSTDLHISQAKRCELENQGCRNGTLVLGTEAYILTAGPINFTAYLQ